MIESMGLMTVINITVIPIETESVTGYPTHYVTDALSVNKVATYRDIALM
jgi:hypothetical protein